MLAKLNAKKNCHQRKKGKLRNCCHLVFLQRISDTIVCENIQSIAKKREKN